mmetsp:Transcript_1880/g.2596  ORF Transcript_1880/g.2596 Transcript_1880/m.2596 type:complete len:210 (-) Transcript_1880:575-1204(-)
MAEEIKHMRQIYGALDLLGDLGGVYEIITLVLAIQMLPISRHSFVLKATKKMYKGRTKDPGLFKIDKKPKYLPASAYKVDDKVKKEQNKNRKISIRLLDSLLLYFTNSVFGRFCCLGMCWRNKQKFQKLYNIGSKRIENELNIVKIMKNIKDMKICLRHSLMSGPIKARIAHTNKKVIDLDETGQSSSEFEQGTLEQELGFLNNSLEQS